MPPGRPALALGKAIFQHRLLIGLVCLSVLFFWASALSFFPVPWPDDAAFFLTGIEWVNWPPRYRMHAQAPFVPSYDVANFNIMPGLPLMLGLGNLAGINGSHGIRVFGMVALALWAILLVLWMARRKLGRRWIWLITLGAVFAPVVRWGAMVVRTEVWQGLLWLLMLMELDGVWGKASRWRLALLLALAAYLHYEAIVWVVPVALGLYPFGDTGGRFEKLRRWVEALLGVAWRAALLLSPWLVYVLWHWDVFWAQMGVQFTRLAGGHPYINSAYGFLHSLFPELGNPLGNPKFLDLGKAVFWLALLVGVARSLCVLAKGGADSRTRAAATAAVATTFYLWVTKPEIWFTVLVHMSFWPLLVLSVSGSGTAGERPRSGLKVAGIAVLLLLLVVEVGVAGEQWRNTHSQYSWDRYHNWVRCIDQEIGDRTRVWQPHWPDALVELASGEPGREYFRAVDFEDIDPLLEKHVQSCEAIIHSQYLPVGEDTAALAYQGGPRELDLYYLRERVPFARFSALYLQDGWRLRICQEGPFWAAVSVRVRR